MATLTNTDFDIEEVDKEKAFSLAEKYTELGFEVTTPRSYDGKVWTFTVSRES